MVVGYPTAVVGGIPTAVVGGDNRSPGWGIPDSRGGEYRQAGGGEPGYNRRGIIRNIPGNYFRDGPGKGTPGFPLDRVSGGSITGGARVKITKGLYQERGTNKERDNIAGQKVYKWGL